MAYTEIACSAIAKMILNINIDPRSIVRNIEKHDPVKQEQLINQINEQVHRCKKDPSLIEKITKDLSKILQSTLNEKDMQNLTLDNALYAQYDTSLAANKSSTALTAVFLAGALIEGLRNPEKRKNIDTWINVGLNSATVAQQSLSNTALSGLSQVGSTGIAAGLNVVISGIRELQYQRNSTIIADKRNSPRHPEPERSEGEGSPVRWHV